MGLWRQQIRPTARVHGIVVEGGTAANIIPDRTVARFMVAAITRDFERMLPRFEKIAQGAALAADRTVDVDVSSVYSTMKDNAVLRERFRSSMVARHQGGRLRLFRLGSSDMGNVSHVVPTIYPYLAICDEGVAGHSIAFRYAAITPRADETTLMAATIVAEVAYDLFTDPYSWMPPGGSSTAADGG